MNAKGVLRRMQSGTTLHSSHSTKLKRTTWFLSSGQEISSTVALAVLRCRGVQPLHDAFPLDGLMFSQTYVLKNSPNR